jgi:hypothetical protein
MVEKLNEGLKEVVGRIERLSEAGTKKKEMGHWE